MTSPEFQVQIPDTAGRMQTPRLLIVPLHVEVEVKGVVVGKEAEPVEDLDDEMVVVEKVEAGAAVLLLDAGAITVM
jgi:hypothetical protein